MFVHSRHAESVQMSIFNLNLNGTVEWQLTAFKLFMSFYVTRYSLANIQNHKLNFQLEMFIFVSWYNALRFSIGSDLGIGLSPPFKRCMWNVSQGFLFGVSDT